MQWYANVVVQFGSSRNWYREQRTHIFQSESALQWFVRKHRRELVDAEALVFIAGQWYAHEQRFDGFVRKDGVNAARQRSEIAA